MSSTKSKNPDINNSATRTKDQASEKSKLEPTEIIDLTLDDDDDDDDDADIDAELSQEDNTDSDEEEEMDPEVENLLREFIPGALAALGAMSVPAHGNLEPTGAESIQSQLRQHSAQSLKRSHAPESDECCFNCRERGLVCEVVPRDAEDASGKTSSRERTRLKRRRCTQCSRRHTRCVWNGSNNSLGTGKVAVGSSRMNRSRRSRIEMLEDVKIMVTELVEEGKRQMESWERVVEFLDLVMESEEFV